MMYEARRQSVSEHVLVQAAVAKVKSLIYRWILRSVRIRSRLARLDFWTRRTLFLQCSSWCPGQRLCQI